MGVSKLSGHFYSGSKLILYPYVVPNILFFCGNAEVDFRIIYFRWTCLTFTPFINLYIYRFTTLDYTRVICSISCTQSCKCTVLKLKEVSRPCGFSLGKVHTEQIHCTVSMVFLFKNTRWMGFTINSCIAHLCSISSFFYVPLHFWTPKRILCEWPPMQLFQPIGTLQTTVTFIHLADTQKREQKKLYCYCLYLQWDSVLGSFNLGQKQTL